LLEGKADIEAIKQMNGQKATVQDLDSTRKMVERLAFEVENRPNFKDLESHGLHTKGLIDDITKELMLKASIKDLCSLLDQKVNVGDMNQTLQLIQNEVERCVRDEDMKKSLNE
jgi:hypothetical protein